jgi:hypothetical protein
MLNLSGLEIVKQSTNPTDCYASKAPLEDCTLIGSGNKPWVTRKPTLHMKLLATRSDFRWIVIMVEVDRAYCCLRLEWI